MNERWDLTVRLGLSQIFLTGVPYTNASFQKSSELDLKSCCELLNGGAAYKLNFGLQPAGITCASTFRSGVIAARAIVAEL